MSQIAPSRKPGADERVGADVASKRSRLHSIQLTDGCRRLTDGLLILPVLELSAEIRVRRDLLIIRKTTVRHIHCARRILHRLQCRPGSLFCLPLLFGHQPIGRRLIGLAVLLRTRLRDLRPLVSEAIHHRRLHRVWFGRIRRRIRKRCCVRVDRDRTTWLREAIRPLSVEGLLGHRWADRLSDLRGLARLTVLNRTIQDDRPGQRLLSAGVGGTGCESNTGQQQDSFRNHRNYFAIEKAMF